MMKLALCACSAAALAACTTYYDPPPVAPVASPPIATVVTPAAGSSRGYGIIESISLVSLPAASASAGGTLPPVASGPYRISVRMDDGTVQTLVADTRAFLVGDRVHLLSDGRLVRP